MSDAPDEGDPWPDGASDAPPPGGKVVGLETARQSSRRARRKPAAEEAQAIEVVVDGRVVTVEAEHELVLRCGKASITLTRAGKIILRGTHLVSRSSGANRIQGSQVRIN